MSNDKKELLRQFAQATAENDQVTAKMLDDLKRTWMESKERFWAMEQVRSQVSTYANGCQPNDKLPGRLNDYETLKVLCMRLGAALLQEHVLRWAAEKIEQEESGTK